VPDPGRADHRVRDYLLAVLQPRREAAVALVKVYGELLANLDPLRLPEPLGIVEEDADRYGVDIASRDSALLKIGRECMNPRGVKVPIEPGPQEHSGGHVGLPEVHRPTKHHGVDVVLER
jgi:hypothetical protein